MGNKKDSPEGSSAPQGTTYGSSASVRAAASVVSLLIVVGSVLPTTAKAGIIADFIDSLKRTVAAPEASAASIGSLQTLEVARAATNIDPAPARGGGDITIVDDTALLPDEGPSGTIADIEKPQNATISVYVVRPGDTLSGIAKLFDVSPNTIRWANDIPVGGSLKVGQTLTILPVTGVKYTVKKGDTLAAIAKRTSADAGDIASFNGLDVSAALDVGSVIIIPDGEAAPSPAPAKVVVKVKTGKGRVSASVGAEPAHDVGPRGSAAEDAYYQAPLSHYIETQGIHGYNGVDLAAPQGTPIMAAADGQVIVAKDGGYNGGYGSYVVIQHDNGSQTLYGHMSRVSVYSGQRVEQGQVIGAVGHTGKVSGRTGDHLHFEIRNGIRNPF